MKSLTNRSKIVSDKKMTFMEWIYIPAIIKGMSITLKHFFGKKATINYPEQKREFSKVYRGQHVLKRDDLGRELAPLAGCVQLPVRLKQLQW